MSNISETTTTTKNDRNESPCGVLDDAQMFIDFCTAVSSSSSSHHRRSQSDPESASPSKEVHVTVHTASTSHHDDAHIHNIINDENPSDSSTFDDRKAQASRHRRERERQPSAIAKFDPQLLNGDALRLLPDLVAITDNVAGDDQLSKQVAAITSTVPKENVLVGKAATTNNPLLETPQHTMNMLQTNAVYFGWIRRSGTKAWRDVVQCFSKNGKAFPVWTDDIHEKVMAKMRVEKGIVNYLIFQQKQPAPGKALFHKSSTNKQQLVGEWIEATNDELLDRTRQRFINDRKPQTKVAGVKRPRGRPPGSAASKSRCRQLD